jgi:ABC-2 type transport system permease protein
MTTKSSTITVPATTARAPRPGRLTATLRGIYIVWYRDLLRFWRDRTRIVASLAQPLLFLVVFGTGLSSSLSGAGGTFGGGGISYVEFVFPGIIGMAVLFSSIFGAMSIVWDREFGFLKEILVAPIDRAAVAIGKTLGGATQAMIQGLILLVLAPFVGVTLTVESVLLLIPCTFVLAFALSAFGVALGSRMTSMQGFQLVMNFLMMPIFFLSGALFPLRGLPDWMAVLVRIDPASYGMDVLRRVALGGSLPGPVIDSLGMTWFDNLLPMSVELLVLIGFGLVMLTISIRNFGRRD